MKKIALFCFALLIFASACNRSTCPSFDKNNDGGTSGGKGKTKSGLFPKKM
jgi:hypothetical protein